MAAARDRRHGQVTNYERVTVRIRHEGNGGVSLFKAIDTPDSSSAQTDKSCRVLPKTKYCGRRTMPAAEMAKAAGIVS